ncbi:MAG: T9SS type A sorting domain-containing protein [Flavobacteriales bacterium]|nr:T9SS type A sorting domain-containing protein [Flavobacteriales bacterium]
MKNRTLPLLILVLLSLFTFSNAKSQCVLPEQFTGNTGVNMTAMLRPSFVQSLPVLDSDAYLVAITESGMVIGSTHVDGENQTSLAIWGNDTFTDEIDGALTGETILLQLVDGSDLYDLELTSLFVNFVPSNSVAFIVNGIALVEGVTVTHNCTIDDETPVSGCTNVNACNYNSEATEDDSSCINPVACETCSGETDGTGQVVGNDSDDDSVCDADEVSGCTDDSMFNFNSEATDDGFCIAVVTGCAEETAFNYDASANTNDGSCEAVVSGCTDFAACNFNSEANTGDSSCEYADSYYDCDGNCLTDADSDGVCDELEVLGCVDATACNYDETATDDDTSCYTISVSVENHSYESQLILVSTEAVGPTFEWYYNDVLLDESTSDIVPNENGAYSVVVTDNQGCSVTAEFMVADVAIEELVEIPMVLYPNPSQYFINIDLELNLSNIQLEVLNSIGDIVLSKTIEGIAVNNTIQIAVNEMPVGLYLLKATIDGKTSVMPWVKN